MNREDLIQIFMEEVEELLSDLSSSLLSLEKSPSDEEIIKQVFRPAHTLKGSCGSFLNLLADLSAEDPSIPAIDCMTKLTHSFESLMSEVRDNGHILTEDEIELLFSCEEKLEELFEGLDEPESLDTDIDYLLNSLALAIENKSISLVESSNSVPESSTEVDNTEVEEESKTDNQVVENADSVQEVNSKNVQVIEGNSDLHSFTTPKVEEVNFCLENHFTFAIEIDIDDNFVSSSLLLFYNDLESEFSSKFDYLISPKQEELGKIQKIDYIKLGVPMQYKEDVENYLKNNIEVLKYGEFKDSKYITTTEVRKVEPKKEVPKEKPKATLTAPTSIATHSANIKVSIDRLDEILKYASKLVILKNKLSNSVHLEDDLISLKEIRDISEEVSKAVENLQNTVMDVRMTPLDQLFSRFPKYVRKVSKEMGKSINFISIGGETEMDKALLDSLSDPLMHLIRNSIDHGVETPEVRLAAGKEKTGTISLSAKHDQGNVIITIEDDGAGINTQKVLKKAIERGVISEEKAKTMSDRDINSLIFHAGLSTADKVTEISGRGVGMDVVKNNIVENMRGQIDIESTLGEGTKTIIRLPLTLAIINAMLTRVNGDVYAFPSSQVESVEVIDPSELKTVLNNEIYILKEKNLEVPIIRLNEFFNIPSQNENPETLSVVIIKTINNYVGVTVDLFIDQEDIVLKNTGKFLGKIPGIGGCNVMGNGEISLVVDVNSIVNSFEIVKK